jgi:hypothetical protein
MQKHIYQLPPSYAVFAPDFPRSETAQALATVLSLRAYPLMSEQSSTRDLRL